MRADVWLYAVKVAELLSTKVRGGGRWHVYSMFIVCFLAFLLIAENTPVVQVGPVP